MILDELRVMILNQDPYAVAGEPDYRYEHTHITDAVIDEVLDRVRPRFWLELGSMLGGSAIRVARRIEARGSDCGVVCVDPFCGDVNMHHWEFELAKSGGWRFLQLVNGRPTIFERFAANVREAGLTHRILPIHATAIVGMRYLDRIHQLGYLSGLPEVIYLDAAHEAGETLLELRTAWGLLPEGGVLMGDDWDWLAVRRDVQRFTDEVGVDVELRENNQWILSKLGAVA